MVDVGQGTGRMTEREPGSEACIVRGKTFLKYIIDWRSGFFEFCLGHFCARSRKSLRQLDIHFVREKGSQFFSTEFADFAPGRDAMQPDTQAVARSRSRKMRRGFVTNVEG
jgi:hypothetical protein